MDNDLNQLSRYSWHQDIWRQIEEAINNNRLHHALLLWGQKGLAKKQFALLLAKYLLCTSKTKVCNACKGCHLFNNAAHPDFLLISPLKGKKNINVEQIRQLQVDLSLTHSSAAPKVILIDAADKMNMSASNALLKSLEEPNDNTIFILVADSISTISATIQSRVHKLYFAPATTSELQQYLSDNGLQCHETAMLHGAPLLAHDYLSTSKILERKTILDDLILFQLGKRSPCAVVSNWAKIDEMFICNILYEWFTDLIKLTNNLTPDCLINKKRLNELTQVLSKIERAKIFMIIDKLALLMRHISFSRQVNVSLWLEDILIDLVN